MEGREKAEKEKGWGKAEKGMVANERGRERGGIVKWKKRRW